MFVWSYIEYNQLDMIPQIIQAIQQSRKVISATSTIDLASCIVFYGDLASGVEKYTTCSLESILYLCDIDYFAKEVFLKCIL